MEPRHSLARAAAAACVVILGLGCFGSHGLEPGERGPDAGTVPDPDAGAPPRADAGGEPGPVPAPSCGGTDGLSFHIETIGTWACEPGRYENVMLYTIEPAPGGVRLLLDLCPLADEDCRCAVTVTGLREARAEEIRIPTDTGPILVAQLADDGLLVEGARHCPVEDASCLRKVIFAAMDGSLEHPPIEPRALGVAWGDRTCTTSSPELGEGCSSTGYELVVTAWVDGFPGPIGSEQRVLEGQVASLDGTGTMFHAVRATAMSCPDARFARLAAWAAWNTR